MMDPRPSRVTCKSLVQVAELPVEIEWRVAELSIQAGERIEEIERRCPVTCFSTRMPLE